MTKQNFLLGRGERLVEDVVIKSGFGVKEAPYTFREAQSRLTPMLHHTVKALNHLPEDACPYNQVIVSLTMNPEYIAKSYFPTQLLSNAGLEVVGSRPQVITPQKRSRDRKPDPAMSTELFARGFRHQLQEWSLLLPSWSSDHPCAEELAMIESISAPSSASKIKGRLPDHGEIKMELVLHLKELNSGSVLQSLGQFLEARQLNTSFGRRFFAQGLCFLELIAPAERAREIATFSPLRALREMPELRIMKPPFRSSNIPSERPNLPSGPPVSREMNIAIFDGGIPYGHPLMEWVDPYYFNGMTEATSDLYEHGAAVSSAALFGHIDPNQPIPRPFSSLNHYRVFDQEPGLNVYELYEVLERIDSVLSQNTFDFINLSIGPHLPVEDDEVHAWTAVLDERLANSSTLAFIAVGNDGESDAITGLNRIQVPSDCVNAMAIGACDTPDDNWRRAPYSSVGPGRSPGRIKPDLVSFGGSVARPFLVVDHTPNAQLTPTGGTSFAGPSSMRIASGIRAHFGPNLNHLAIRALLVHTAEQGEIDACEIGWGRIARSLDDIVLCADDEVRIVYQGEISPAKYIRAAIPLPSLSSIKGNVNFKATLCYKTPVDPHHPGNYTRAGLEATFRPNAEKFSRPTQVHADTKTFFGASSFGATEDELRRDAWKWENCLHASKRMRASSLNNPVFDIHYNARRESGDANTDMRLHYALVISVKANRIADLYDQVVRQYAGTLEPLKPIVDVPVQSLGAEISNQ